MAHTIFFSWQSDVRSRAGRGLIEDSLNAAIKALKQDTALEPAHRKLTIDRDVMKTPGIPPLRGIANFRGLTMAAGDIAGGIGAGYLAKNGMFGEAVNTVAETILDKPFPEPFKPYADQVIDASLNGIEGSLGLSLNSCRVR